MLLWYLLCVFPSSFSLISFFFCSWISSILEGFLVAIATTLIRRYMGLGGAALRIRSCVGSLSPSHPF